ncbi:MAG: FecR domain-containing protein [Chitinophagaceae bacterium]
MNEEQNNIVLLLDRYATGSATHAEETELFSLIANAGNENEIKQYLIELQERQQPSASFDRRKWQPILDSILNHSDIVVSNTTPVHRIFSWKRIAVAASVISVIGFGIAYFVVPKQSEKPSVAETQQQRFKNDVKPGGHKASLTLADGRIIILDSVTPGQLAIQGSTAVLNKNGQLVYQTGEQKNDEVLFNTLLTARGETYTTVLADGSKVWLNSASSIKYPVAFTGKERRVEITGEAYFEVRHNTAKPFVVKFNTPSGDGGEVHDLGTAFNINAYTDEATIKTTLVSGSARVVKVPISGSEGRGGEAVLLVPGQQAVIAEAAAESIRVVANADVEEATAWRNGRFLFKSTDIKTLMRQLIRWYDVEVSYDAVPAIGFNAKITRETPLSSILKALELTGEVKFRLEGKKLVVMK